MSVAVLSGGVGAAKLLAGMVRAVAPESVTAIVNVGDDLEMHGLNISPDLDTVVYTLADAIDPERGWGLRDESWNAMEALERYGSETWFRLGDRDLATHFYRTGRLREGYPLSKVTAEIASAWGLEARILPVTDDRLRTMITLLEPPPAEEAASGGDGGGGGGSDDEPTVVLRPRPSPRVVPFQEYFVRRQHAVPVAAVRFDGELDATPAPGVLDAISGSDKVVIAPSNPVVSIGPLLAVSGIPEAIIARRDDVVAVSPIVGGKALKGPADRMLGELGHEPSVVGIARLYAPLAGTLVIDETDADRAEEVEKAGLRCVVTDTIMRDPETAAQLCETVLGDHTTNDE